MKYAFWVFASSVADIVDGVLRITDLQGLQWGNMQP